MKMRLTQNLNDRIAASEAPGKIGDPGATEALIQALEDKNKNLAETAARSLVNGIRFQIRLNRQSKGWVF